MFDTRHTAPAPGTGTWTPRGKVASLASSTILASPPVVWSSGPPWANRAVRCSRLEAWRPERCVLASRPQLVTGRNRILVHASVSLCFAAIVHPRPDGGCAAGCTHEASIAIMYCVLLCIACALPCIVYRISYIVCETSPTEKCRVAQRASVAATTIMYAAVGFPGTGSHGMLENERACPFSVGLLAGPHALVRRYSGTVF